MYVCTRTYTRRVCLVPARCFYAFRVMRMDTHIRMHTYIQYQPTYTIGLCNIRMFWLRQAIMSIALSNAIFLPSGIAIFLPIRSQGTGAERPRSAFRTMTGFVRCKGGSCSTTFFAIFPGHRTTEDIALRWKQKKRRAQVFSNVIAEPNWVASTSACPRQCPCRFSLAYSVLICKATGGATDGQGQGEEQEQMG